MAQKTIIHGHFYQTPMMRPETGLIDANRQDSYERITAECYAPNSASRILDGSGKITDIINNYQYISYDFDPTLLGWLKKCHADVYQRIIDADKASVGLHNGHGNAIASSYCHSIMPLSTFEDKRTQIIWGLRSFEYHFGRRSEGMWLAECAVDYQTIDLLIENEVKFVILSSDQARACRRISDNDNGESADKSWLVFDADHYVDTNDAYTIRRAHGEIDVFFYNKALSDAVSFEHLLRDANALADRIRTVNEPAEDTENRNNENEQSDDKPQPQCVKITDDGVVTIAADGKVFGHYEPFADMCLSGLISRYVIGSNDIRLLNPAEYLSECQPHYEVLLGLGEDNLGSSWSCPHGVGRWYRECGCRSGDGSQAWRSALRDALNLVKNEADEIFIRYATGRLNSAIDVRNDYIEFINNGYDTAHTEWLTRHAVRELSNEETVNILRLLEAQRCVMMSFCSDAWFGDDIYSDAALQSLRLAHRAMSILEWDGSKIRSTVEDKLSEAKSNYPGKDSGRAILEYYVYKHFVSYEHIINNMLSVYRIQRHLDMPQFALFGMYQFNNLSIEAAAGQSDLYIGDVTVTDRRIAAAKKFSYVYQILSDKSYRVFIADEEHSAFLLAQADFIAKGGNAAGDGCVMLTENDLDTEVKAFILEHRYQSYTHALLNQNIAGYGDVRMQVSSYMAAGTDLPEYLGSQLLACADSIIEDIASKLTSFPTEGEYKLLHEVFVLTGHFGRHPHAHHLAEQFIAVMTHSLTGLSDICCNICSDVVVLLQFCNKVGLSDVRIAAENVIFPIFRRWTGWILDNLPSVTDESLRNEYLLRYKQLIIMADQCNISASVERKRMMSYLTDSETDNPHRF